jgi:acetyl esterase/lipase
MCCKGRLPGYPSNPRMLLARLYLQLGIALDYYTGNHVRSLSSVLRDALNGPIPDVDLPLFPQFGVDKHWPPTFLMHGTDDSVVPIQESRNICDLLKQSGVPVTLVELKGEHLGTMWRMLRLCLDQHLMQIRTWSR